ncbi:hypothetical protein F511_39848 [Dorcoceras hygrometricum]|uniref:Uncharacterized protein n=1 Tax=Dorcoceras hygrometricum TaxID=472368 RepID=A0A2Z7BMP0_9LAMI|nr:hypothetical protein F511_39848 [Dorcoceras hygrometricum]
MYTGSIGVHPLLMEGIQLAVGPQPLRLRNHNFELAQRIMIKRLATSPHDPLDSIGYPRMRASGESSTTKHRLLHASGSHPIPPPNDPKSENENRRNNSPGRRLARRRPPCRARASARATPSRAGRAMDDLMSRAGRATRARWPSDCTIVAGGWRRCIARAVHAVARGAARVAASLDDGRASCSAAARYAGRRWAKLLDARRRCWSAMVRTGCACSTLLVARACVRRRALPPRFRGGGAAVAGRRSGESPAMS